MGTKFKAMASLAALLAALSFSASAAAQTNIFNTKDYRQDRALWANPAYYRNNTPSELSGMALNIVPYQAEGQVGAARLYGSQGRGVVGGTKLASPYPFKTAMEHYDTWLKDAKGGAKFTKANAPDWSGIWIFRGMEEGNGPASDVVKFLKPKYQEYYVQQLKAASEARRWSAAALCLPRGFFGAIEAQEFIITPGEIWALSSTNTENTVRWIFTDGSGHAPADFQYPKWHGESIGFWNGDTLIVHTNQIRGWNGGPGGEYSDKLETVEKYRRKGDTIQAEITLYDPDVFVGPAFERFTFTRSKETKLERKRPIYNTCSDTNGPSPGVYLDQKGFLNEHVPGEPGFDWNAADPRPWGTWLTESDRRYRAYVAAGGKPPVQADQTPANPGTGRRERERADR